ncbi:MAG: ankyrin repeat domain-containing protein [Ghiorsea sp.]
MNTTTKWFEAAKSGGIATLKSLLTDNVDMQDEKQNTALHLATKLKQYDTMRFIITHGASLNIQNNELSTPLHLCGKDIDAIRILLEAGADPNLLNKDYNYPYYYAFYGSMSKDLTCLYIKHGANLIYKKDM